MITILTRRFSRRALTKPNTTYYLWRFVANAARSYRAMMTRRQYKDTLAIARELKSQGIVVKRSDSLLSDFGRQALEAAAEAVLRTSASPPVQAIVSRHAPSTNMKKDFVVELVPRDRIAAEDPLLKVALDAKLLESISLYLGMWPRLHSISAWLNRATHDPAAKSQLWHRDPEDLQVVKAFIYLTDVDDQCGPFTYITKTQIFGADAGTAHKRLKNNRVSDVEMSRVFPPNSWCVCVGKARTMILADTTGYHRGGKPADNHTRILITFTYTSGTPATASPLRVSRKPTWIAAPIQHLALLPNSAKKKGTSWRTS